MSPTTACPPPGTLARLVAGELTGPHAVLVEEHLAACPRCTEEVARSAAGDPLVANLREGRRLHTNLPDQPGMSDLIAQLKARLGSASDTPEQQQTVVHDASGPPAEPPPERVGSYHILRELGRGGMGTVYEAEDDDLKRRVAIKLMRRTLADRESNRERFLREARAQASLRDPHLVTIHQVGEADGRPFLVMELLAGESLEDFARREPRPPAGFVAEVGRQAATGLAVAHRAGLVHRDVKPSNLFLTPGEPDQPPVVKVLDFGLVRATAADRVTNPNLIVGTPAFMSPEQAAGRPVDARSDLFSLGVVLYVLCTGEQPFEGPDNLAILTRLMTEEPRPVTSLNPTVPPRLAALIRRLMAKDPDARPATAAEVADELAAIAADIRRPNRRRLLAAVQWAGIAALVMCGVILIIRDKDGKETKYDIPDGSTAVITPDGKVVVMLPAPEGKADAESPTDVAKDKVIPMKPGRPSKSAAPTTPMTPADALVHFVKTEMLRLNPGSGDDWRPTIDKEGRVTALRIPVHKVNTIAPLARFVHLKRLEIVPNMPAAEAVARGIEGGVTDLSPLKDLPLEWLALHNCRGLRDVTPLKTAPLKHLTLPNSSVTDVAFIARTWPQLEGLTLAGSKEIADISPLQGMKLTGLNLNGTSVSKLSAVAGMPLKHLFVGGTSVSDLSPLKGMQLTMFTANDTPVTEIGVLQGMPLTNLDIIRTKVTDLSVLKGMPLRTVRADFQLPRDAELLRGIPTLETINGQPAADVLK